MFKQPIEDLWKWLCTWRQSVQGPRILLILISFPRFARIRISWKTSAILHEAENYHWILSLALFPPYTVVQKKVICFHFCKSNPYGDSSLNCMSVFWTIDIILDVSNWMFHRPRMSTIELNDPEIYIFTEFLLSANGTINASVTETQKSLLDLPCPLPSLSGQSSSLVIFLSNLYSLLFSFSKCLYWFTEIPYKLILLSLACPSRQLL